MQHIHNNYDHVITMITLITTNNSNKITNRDKNHNHNHNHYNYHNHDNNNY